MAIKDFLTRRTRTAIIVGSGDVTDKPALMVYPETSALDKKGGFTNEFMLEAVGTDVTNFFSGSIGSMVYEDEEGITQPHNGERGVNLFGGDVHVSGTLFVNGNVISNSKNLGDETLKGYEEFGDFLLSQEVLGNDSIAIGNDLTASSDNSIVIGYENKVSGSTPQSNAAFDANKYKFVIGGQRNTVYTPQSYIFGGFNNEISGSGLYNTILGGKNNKIHPDDFNGNIKYAFENAIINSSNVKISGSIGNIALNSSDSLIYDSSENNVLLNSSNVELKGLSEKNFVFGDNNSLEGTYNNNDPENSSNFNFLFANNTQLYQSNKNIAFGLNQGDRYDNNIQPRGYLSITGSNENFIVGKKTLTINDTTGSFIFAGNNDRLDPELLDTETTHFNQVGDSFVFADNVGLYKVKNSFIGATNNLTLTDVSNSLILNVEPVNNLIENIINNDFANFASLTDKLNEEKVLSGLPDATYLFENQSSFNTMISTKGSVLNHSYFSTIIGGFNQHINGFNNSIIGGYSNEINDLTRNSFILGSVGSRISQPNSSHVDTIEYVNSKNTNSIIIGSYNQIDSSNSFSIGLNNVITNNDSFIFGKNNRIEGENSYILGSEINSYKDNYIVIGTGNSSKLSISRNTAVILSSSLFKFGDLTKEQLYGTEVNFFVSGSVGSRERHFIDPSAGEYGVAVFGGDVHISGTLSGGNFGLEKLFLEGGDAKGKNRKLGNKDNFDLSLITNGKQRLRVDKHGAVCIGEGEGVYPLLHLRSGSHLSNDFQTSLDYQAAKYYPFVISRDVDNVNEEQNEYETGMAFQIMPNSQLYVDGNPQFDDDGNPIYSDSCTYTLDDEPGAAITHYQDKQGSSSQGGLKFKTKTSDGQIRLTIPERSLSTKMKITSEGFLLLGNDNPNDQHIDLRATGSDYPLIQASGSEEDPRTVFLMEHDIPRAQVDTNFYVRGHIGSKVENGNFPSEVKRGTSVFGGDLVVSGNLWADMNVNVSGDVRSRDRIMSVVVPEYENENSKLNLISYGADFIDLDNPNLHIYSKGDGTFIQLNAESRDPVENTNTRIYHKAAIHNFYPQPRADVTSPHLSDDNPTYIYAEGHVRVRDSVTSSYTEGKGYLGNGERLSNVNMSSVWQPDPNNPDQLILTGEIDGNTGIMKFELDQFRQDIVKMHQGEIAPEDLETKFTTSTNTRLYDSYLTFERQNSGNVFADTNKVYVYRAPEGLEDQPHLWPPKYTKHQSTLFITDPREHLIVIAKENRILPDGV